MPFEADGAYGNPTNSEIIYVQPGATGTVRVIYGYNYTHPGYALRSSEIIKRLFFSGKVKTAQTYRVVSLQAGGEPGEKWPEPPVSPEAKRIKPKDRLLFGAGMEIDPAKQIAAEAGGVGRLGQQCHRRRAIAGGFRDRLRAGLAAQGSGGSGRREVNRSESVGPRSAFPRSGTPGAAGANTTYLGKKTDSGG